MPNWLKDAVFYEIYPQSFNDSNGDGIGDIQGIIEKLDYIKELGCNALWINPWYDSPFKDAGYDVRDYCKVAARYGTNEDAARLFKEAHERGIHVLLDLVPGHTSEEHPWFQESGKEERNEYSDRFIWTDSWFMGMPGHLSIGGEMPRNGVYMLNFFKCQPSLNYGFYEPKEPWQKPMRDPACLATRQAMKDVMDFWLGMGCDGFRTDMSDSLVKEDDEQKSGTCAVWRDLLGAMREKYPEAAFVSEWSNPWQALESAGFDMDFYLEHWHNGYHTLLRDHQSGAHDRSYFRRDISEETRDISRFLEDYLKRYEVSVRCSGEKQKHYVSFMTCNHDTPRARWTLTPEELKIAYAFIFTMPGVPFLYYGDEIGMRYLADLPTKEGGYTRTGTRTPMQWDRNRSNFGFSEADADKLYLPQDPAEDAPDAASQAEDPDSLLNTVKAVLKLRHEYEDLQADAPFTVILAEKGKPFIYRRGSLILAVNPSPIAASAEVGELLGRELIFSIGNPVLEEDTLRMSAGSFAVLR
ncbi:MAG: glycosylase [Lachnospiraceae bacterium]|nr:glycosylase [Lachnospiraceae bacterium]